jgi:hypothetical protein
VRADAVEARQAPDGAAAGLRELAQRPEARRVHELLDARLEAEGLEEEVRHRRLLSGRGVLAARAARRLVAGTAEVLVLFGDYLGDASAERGDAADPAVDAAADSQTRPVPAHSKHVNLGSISVGCVALFIEER